MKYEAGDVLILTSFNVKTTKFFMVVVEAYFDRAINCDLFELKYSDQLEGHIQKGKFRSENLRSTVRRLSKEEVQLFAPRWVLKELKELKKP